MSESGLLFPGQTAVVDSDGRVELFEQAFDAPEADRLFEVLSRTIDWSQHRLLLFGREIPAPRLSAWYGEPGCRYRYSGLQLEPTPLSDELAGVRARILTLTGLDFNCVLLNYYRDGSDSMSWHADDEPELGPEPDIASVSLGARRRFLLKHKTRDRERIEIEPSHGSLLLMRAPLQRYWVHSVPKTARAVGERINLTWRYIDPQITASSAD